MKEQDQKRGQKDVRHRHSFAHSKARRAENRHNGESSLLSLRNITTMQPAVRRVSGRVRSPWAPGPHQLGCIIKNMINHRGSDEFRDVCASDGKQKDPIRINLWIIQPLHTQATMVLDDNFSTMDTRTQATLNTRRDRYCVPMLPNCIPLCLNLKFQNVYRRSSQNTPTSNSNNLSSWIIISVTFH